MGSRIKFKTKKKWHFFLQIYLIISVFFYGVSSVFSAVPPVLVLESADNISRTYALISSVVTDSGGSDIVNSGFEYGLTENYGSSIDVSPNYAYSNSFGSIGVGNGQFDHPYGISADSSGNIFVVDIGNNRIQKFDSSGNYLSQFGSSGSGDGQLSLPFGVTTDSSDSVYVTETGNSRVSIFNSAGVFVSKFGSFGSGDGQFDGPIGLSVDSSGNIFVVDSGNDRIQKFDSSGNYLSQFGSTGSGNGQFNQPTHVDIDSFGNIFVTDMSNNRIQKFDSSGNYLSQFGSTGSGNGQFNQPTGIYIDQYDTIYIVDSVGSPRRVQKFDSSGNYLSQFGSTGSGNGQFLYPLALTMNESTGDIYVTDYNSRNVEVFSLKISTGLSSLVCGSTYHFRSFAENSSGIGYSDDGSFETSECLIPIVQTNFATNVNKKTATLNGYHPVINQLVGIRRGFDYGKSINYGQTVEENSDVINNVNYSALNSRGIALDSSGNIFVSDSANNRIQKFDSSGNYLSQFGSTGSGDGQFKTPYGIALDSSGNIFVSDSANNRIQKFDSSGNYLSQFGSTGSGDGQFKTPYGIALDSSGNIFVSDSANNRIQKFDSSGNYLSQFGSTGSGDGQFKTPYGIALDSSGNIFVSDSANNRIQKFDSSGNYLSQFGSTGSGDGQFKTPYGIALDSSGNIFVSDSANNRIQKFDSSGNYLFSIDYDYSPYSVMVDGYNIYVGYNSALFKISPEFSFNIESLDCDSTYNFRFFSENEDGLGYGDNQQFTTSSCGSSGGGSNPNPPTPVLGCTDSDASNYNPSATQNNGTCLYMPGAILGCTDDNAGNYDSSVTVDDGSCLYGVFGCMDQTATNYNPSAVHSDNSCTYAPVNPPPGDNDTPGCTDQNAENYNSSADVDNGSCIYPPGFAYGCTDFSAINFDSNATQDDGSCEYENPINPPDPTNPPDPINPSDGGDGGIGKSVSSFLENNSQTIKTISVVGVITPFTLPFVNLGNGIGVVSLAIRIWNLIPTLLGFKRRKRPWGTVYDSVTKQPLDPVYVTLKDGFGKDISTSITDLDGRYGFQVSPGNYSIVVNKANYNFPSVKLAGKTEDDLYHNLYFGGPITVESGEEIINKNIPMDAINFNWNEFEKAKNKKLMKFYSKTELFLARISKVLFVAGIISSVALSILEPKTFNFVILGLYVLILILALVGIKPRAFGFVTEKETGYPLSFGIISVFSSELRREVAHTVIGKTGRYYLLVPKGDYFIKIKKKISEDGYQDIYESESFSVKKGYVNEILKI